MAGDYEIREGGREDLPRIEPLWRSMYDHHLEVGTFSVQPIPADERWPERLRGYEEACDAGRAVVLFAERDGEAVGVAFSTMHPPDPVFHSGPIGELDTLAVLPGHRGGGIGEALMERSLAALRARGAGTLKVIVMAGNEPALRFYSRHGVEPALIELMAPLAGEDGDVAL